MNKLGLYLLCLLMAVLPMSCCKNKAAGKKSADQDAAVLPEGTQGSDDMAAHTPGYSLKAEEQNNDISFRLWNLIDQKRENTFFSPYSINAAVAMVYNGSEGNTAKEIASVMAYDFSPQEAHPALTRMQRMLSEKSGRKPAEVKVANGIFTAQKSAGRLMPDYLDLLRKEYLAEHHSLDFGRAKETANFINKWIETNTNNRIKNMVDAEQVESSDNGLFLANAIYFKAEWAHQFSKSSTREDIFYTSSARRKDESMPIEMMEIKANFPYARIPGYQLLQMPYEDSRYAMLFVLPDEIDDIAKDLNAKTLQEWQEALSPAMKVKAFIPRFKIEQNLDKLAEVFQGMGMKDAFSPARADFSGIMKQAMGANLYIADIAHKAFLQIQEEGTEAAAATVIGMATTSMPAPDPEMPVFRADQPFLCLILHKPDNTILFAGKVVKPQRAEK